MKVGFWSEPVRLWLLASGRQDIVDRGDALAQRATALLVAVRQRADQYLALSDLYSGNGGLPEAGDTMSSAMADIDEFVNVRLRDEISVLESFMSTFDDLRLRPPTASAQDVAESLLTSVVDENVAGFVQSTTPDGRLSVMAMTVLDPGPGPAGLVLAGHPFFVVRAPRSVRRRIFASGK